LLDMGGEGSPLFRGVDPVSETHMSTLLMQER
jgi:hypothetical protein